MEWKGIRGQVLKNVPMKRYTSMKVGGPARYMVYPVDHADFDHTVALPVQAFANQRGINIFAQRYESLGYYGLHSERQGLTE